MRLSVVFVTTEQEFKAEFLLGEADTIFFSKTPNEAPRVYRRTPRDQYAEDEPLCADKRLGISTTIKKAINPDSQATVYARISFAELADGPGSMVAQYTMLRPTMHTVLSEVPAPQTSAGRRKIVLDP